MRFVPIPRVELIGCAARNRGPIPSIQKLALWRSRPPFYIR